MDLDYKKYLSEFNDQVRETHLEGLKYNLEDAKNRVIELENELKETIELFKNTAVAAVEAVQEKAEEVVEVVKEEVKKAAPKKSASKKAATKKDEAEAEVVDETAPEKDAASDK
jgi:hypothetical protein